MYIIFGPSSAKKRNIDENGRRHSRAKLKEKGEGKEHERVQSEKKKEYRNRKYQVNHRNI